MPDDKRKEKSSNKNTNSGSGRPKPDLRKLKPFKKGFSNNNPDNEKSGPEPDKIESESSKEEKSD